MRGPNDYAALVHVTYDTEASALAIRLSEGPVSRTVEVEPGTLVDIDTGGRVLMIEVINPGRRWALDEIAERFPLSDADLAVLRGMVNADAAIEVSEPAPLAVA